MKQYIVALALLCISTHAIQGSSKLQCPAKSNRTNTTAAIVFTAALLQTISGPAEPTLFASYTANAEAAKQYQFTLLQQNRKQCPTAPKQSKRKTYKRRNNNQKSTQVSKQYKGQHKPNRHGRRNRH